MIIALILIDRTIPGFNELSDSVRRIFKAKIIGQMIDLPMTRSFRKERKQFEAGRLLLDLVHFKPPDADKTVFLIREDIYANNLNFVFGLASSGVCIVSTTRLDPRFYEEMNMENARVLFKKRLLKEVVHELGHTMGLPHCDNKKCAMVYSNSIEDIDFKDEELCERCSKALYLDK